MSIFGGTCWSMLVFQLLNSCRHQVQLYCILNCALRHCIRSSKMQLFPGACIWLRHLCKLSSGPLVGCGCWACCFGNTSGCQKGSISKGYGRELPWQKGIMLCGKMSPWAKYQSITSMGCRLFKLRCDDMQLKHVKTHAQWSGLS